MKNKNEVLMYDKNKLSIFKTNEDRYKNDITLMSNFFDNYIQEMSLTLKDENSLLKVSKMPISNIGILNDVLCKGETITIKDDITLIPDFKSLPPEIKSKLEKGIYKIANSKQVDGNFRAVIVDENNSRIKDVTLKVTENNLKSKELESNILIQQQMKQIYQKLIEIQEFQVYQNDKDRDSKILVPFLDARDKILLAETKNTECEITELLKEADDKITTAIHHIYTDIETTSKSLAQCVRNPINTLNPMKNNFMRWITSDLQIISKYIGVRLQLLNYLGENEHAKKILQQYQVVMNDFFNKKITKNGMSAVELLQDHFPYGKNDDKNYWYNLSRKMQPIFNLDINELKNKVYFVSLEDSNEK